MTKAEKEAAAAEQALDAVMHAADRPVEVNDEPPPATPEGAVPTYETDEEIAAARGMYGHSYDRLIERGQIIAPTSAELAERGAEDTGTRRKSTAKKAAKKRSKR